jgi:hypothetical protein
MCGGAFYAREAVEGAVARINANETHPCAPMEMLEKMCIHKRRLIRGR